MSLFLLTIAIVSSLVCIGIVYLMLQQQASLPQNRKVVLLSIIITIIFISLLISTIKAGHLQQIFDSILYQQEQVSVDTMFTCYRGKSNHNEYIKKYNNLQLINTNAFTDKNYKALKNYDSDQHEMIIYKSNKDEGCSHFLYHQSVKLCDEGYSILYLKLEDAISSEAQFIHQHNLHSWQLLEKAMCSEKQTHKYIIIDNYDYLLDTLSEQTMHKHTENQQYLLLIKLINRIMLNCEINTILNTEHHTTIYDLHRKWAAINRNRHHYLENTKYSSFPFQVNRWIGPNSYEFHSLINSQNALPDSVINFRTMSYFMQPSSQKLLEDEQQLKQSQVKTSVAYFHSLDKSYNLLRGTNNRVISALKKQIKKIGLIEIQSGIVVLK